MEHLFASVTVVDTEEGKRALGLFLLLALTVGVA
jgi:hypothetical protein